MNTAFRQRSKSREDGDQSMFKKSFRQSGLRKSLKFDDEDDEPDRMETGTDEDSASVREKNETVVVRPRKGGSIHAKRPRPSSSRLSFGLDEPDSPRHGANTVTSTPKAAPSRPRTGDDRSQRKSIVLQGLSSHEPDEGDGRSRYSQAYLQELQDSTPINPLHDSTPVPFLDNDPDFEIDPSELDGAVIVDSSEVLAQSAPQTVILTEAEIRERKDRKTRRAVEPDFISFADDDVDLPSRRKQTESRISPDDEDMGEGFESYVEVDPLLLGRRAEREARRRRRREMAELITQAEGNTEESSSESEAERRVAYETAQTRAGMDGIRKTDDQSSAKVSTKTAKLPAKITQLPNLTEALSSLNSIVTTLRNDLTAREVQVRELNLEKADILQRENEVQRLLNEAGEKYRSAMTDRMEDGGNKGSTNASSMAVDSGAAPSSFSFLGRGLESLG